ncbi:MAG: response regulator transcription factor [Proteobacteria bacterium]|nr:response regulator transcription factor [Pseudomonadota bacterium]
MGKTILIIDDEEDIREVLSAVLKIQGYEVLTAESGLKGIDIFRENKDLLALVLLDVMLPDVDGFQIIQVIRKESKVPVIMLTAKDRTSDKILGLELGADDYVVKPFDTSELLARIKAVMRRYDEDVEKNNIITPKDIFVDEEKRKVKLKDKEVFFTYTEFELFKYLLRRANEVVTRNEIKNALWKEKELYQWSRTIDVHISHIREKIEDNPEDPEFLVTVPQKGYKLKIS